MLTSVQKSIFDGIMISDGHIEKSSKNARFSMSVKHESFANIPFTLFTSLPFKKPKFIKFLDKRSNKYYSRYECRSRVHEFFTEQHNRWYSKGKKIVPKDIVLTSEMLIWWYIGDGYLRKTKSRPNYRRVELQTQGFYENERMFLVNILSDCLGCSSVYDEKGYICIAKKALCSFIQKVGLQSPIPEYSYKFDFGSYTNDDYFVKSYKNRPLAVINKYRKKYKVRELDFNIAKTEMANG
tara:strand:+ start:1302 stop:2018 length:717 start_codon:yes stop_codon:yes gene_type:complete